MEYGRLVVLGYSSYRVASVQAQPSSQQQQQPPLSQSSFGLGVASGSVSAATQLTAASTPPPPSSSSPASSTASPAVVLGRTGSSSGNGRYSSSRKSLGQLWEPIGDQNAQFVLQRRKRANGVALSHFHHFRRAAAAAAEPAQPLTPARTATASKSKDLQAVAARLMLAVEQQRAAELKVAASNNAALDASGGTASSSSSSSSSSSDADPSERATRAPEKTFLLCVPMNGSDAHASLTEYKLDPATDMFQIGRLPCRQNDFVIPGPRVGASGTISRFAARIVCSREPPYQCRIYAGGFDAHRRTTTAGHALKYCAGCATWFKKIPLDHLCVAPPQLAATHGGGSSRIERAVRRRESNQSGQPAAAAAAASSASPSRSPSTKSDDDDMEHVELAINDSSEVPVDGVTKNGVRVWIPEHKQWFEVSVNGNLYGIENRSAATPRSSATRNGAQPSSATTAVRHSTFNRPIAGSDGVPPVLTDGAIIDLGGVQLQFQTDHRFLTDDFGSLGTDGEDAAISSVADQLERLNVQCPVQLHSLRFARGEAEEEMDPIEIPHVFPACGHVFGYEERIATSQVCPLCRHPGFLVKLLLKENSQLQSAAERHAIPECVLNPCGHAISRKLAAHYSKLVMPNGRAICPFCAAHLHPTTPYSRLFLYSEENEHPR